MKGRLPKAGKEVPRLEVPDDVAVLYAWAKLEGARYRDFSALRRESRAGMRQQAAQAERATAALAKSAAEDAAAGAERAARKALETAKFHEAQARRALSQERPAELEQEQAAQERAMQQAGELSRLALRERAEATRRAEALRSAEVIARRETREVAAAHASAERQAERYAEGEDRTAAVLTSERLRPLSTLTDPYTARPQAPPARVLAESPLHEEDMRPERFPQRRAPRFLAAAAGETVGAEAGTGSSPQPLFAAQPGRTLADADRVPQDAAVDVPQIPDRRASRPPASLATPTPLVKPMPAAEVSETSGSQIADVSKAAPKPFVERRSEPRPAVVVPLEEHPELDVPAWIYGQAAVPGTERARPMQTAAASSATDTLQRSRERVASRWFAMRGVFDATTPEMEPIQARARETASPVLAIFSLAGGAGKTSLTASLGRSLSAIGEKVLLADMTPAGMLPFYFGATELRPGAVRTFNPPPGVADAPVAVLSFDPFRRGEGSEGSGVEDSFVGELARSKENFAHVLVDLGPAAVTVLKGLARQGSLVLVPVVPDMNTVFSLASMERFFAGMTDSDGRPLQPRYLLTQFDATLPLHLDVREGLRQKLGRRLLPFVIRRSTEVAEALAEGMTVIDYAPESGVASDYRNLASWVRSLAAPSYPEDRPARWSER